MDNKQKLDALKNEHGRWVELTVKATRLAGKYVPWGKTPNLFKWTLALKLQRFAKSQYTIANNQYWALFYSLKHEHDF